MILTLGYARLVWWVAMESRVTRLAFLRWLELELPQIIQDTSSHLGLLSEPTARLSLLFPLFLFTILYNLNCTSVSTDVVVKCPVPVLRGRKKYALLKFWHAHANACTQTHMHMCARTCMHARTHTHMHTHTPSREHSLQMYMYLLVLIDNVHNVYSIPYQWQVRYWRHHQGTESKFPSLNHSFQRTRPP